MSTRTQYLVAIGLGLFMVWLIMSHLTGGGMPPNPITTYPGGAIVPG